MITYMPLSQWPAPLVPMHPPFSHLDAIAWLPLSDGELMLAAHYYPLAVRLDGAAPVIGALIRRSMMVRSLIGPNGRWSGAYTPIALRCFPMRMTGEPAGDPLADLEIARIAPGPVKPAGFKLKNEAGQPSKELLSLYEGLQTLRQGQSRLAAALDLLLVANVLVPINDPDAIAGSPAFYTVDRQRFSRASNHTLEAMARHTFTSIDLVTVLTFSQAQLRADLRPRPEVVPPASSAPVSSEQSYGFESILPWLDTSELFPVAWAADLAAWAAGAPSKSSAEVAADR
jgi:SapC